VWPYLLYSVHWLDEALSYRAHKKTNSVLHKIHYYIISHTTVGQPENIKVVRVHSLCSFFCLQIFVRQKLAVSYERCWCRDFCFPVLLCISEDAEILSDAINTTSSAAAAAAAAVCDSEWRGCDGELANCSRDPLDAEPTILARDCQMPMAIRRSLKPMAGYCVESRPDWYRHGQQDQWHLSVIWTGKLPFSGAGVARWSIQ